MAYTIKIGKTAVDVTSRVKSRSLKIFKEYTTKNTLEVLVYWKSTESKIKAGQEIIVADGSTVKFGGIIQQAIKEEIAVGKYLYRVSATGYEQICTRRTFSISNYTGKAGALISSLVSNYMSPASPYSEGIVIGNIDDGISLKNFTEAVISGNKLFDSLAKSSGFTWWINDEREFYFQEKPTITIGTKNVREIDTTTPDPLKLDDVRNPMIIPGLDEYVNNQFVVGKSQAGQVIYVGINDVTSITEMSDRYGSGVFGSVEYDNEVETYADAVAAATALLQKRKDDPLDFLFTTGYSGLDVNDLITVNFPSLDIEDDSTFLIKKVTIRDEAAQLVYQVACEYKPTTVGAEQSQKEHWTQKFNKFNYSYAEAANPDSGVSDTFDSFLFMFNDASYDITTTVQNKNRELIMSSPAHTFIDIALQGTASQALELRAKLYLGVWNISTLVYDYTAVKTFKFDAPNGLERSFHVRHVIMDMIKDNYSIKIEIDTSVGTFTCANAKDLYFWVSTQGLLPANADIAPLPAPPYPVWNGLYWDASIISTYARFATSDDNERAILIDVSGMVEDDWIEVTMLTNAEKFEFAAFTENIDDFPNPIPNYPLTITDVTYITGSYDVQTLDVSKKYRYQLPATANTIMWYLSNTAKETVLSVNKYFPAPVVGGNGRLYSCEDTIHKFYELDPDSLVFINDATSVSGTPTGMGGIEDRLYACDSGTNKINELDPDSLAIVTSLTSPSGSPSGVGGTLSRLYNSDYGTLNYYEVNPDSIAIINTVSSPATRPFGIGGMEERLFACDQNADKYYEIDPDSLVVINTVASTGTTVTGIGGMNDRLYACDSATDKYYEIDPDSLVATNTVASVNTLPNGIGGMKLL